LRSGRVLGEDGGADKAQAWGNCDRGGSSGVDQEKVGPPDAGKTDGPVSHIEIVGREVHLRASSGDTCTVAAGARPAMQTRF